MTLPNRKADLRTFTAPIKAPFGGDGGQALCLPEPPPNIDWRTRKARKQTTESRTGQEKARQRERTLATYNIWYDKFPGEDKKTTPDAAHTRCNLELDTGMTKGDTHSSAKHLYCILFAKGGCSQGYDCTYYHRLPPPEDERKFAGAVDIFGRGRHWQDRADMGGVGSMMKWNRTLYVCGFPSVGDVRQMVTREFQEWGELEYIHVVRRARRHVAFIRYRFKVHAEFAKEAMMNQCFAGTTAPISVRWAMDDPNVAHQIQDDEDRLVAGWEHIKKTQPQVVEAMRAEMDLEKTGVYPGALPIEGSAAAAPESTGKRKREEGDGAAEDESPAKRANVGIFDPAFAQPVHAYDDGYGGHKASFYPKASQQGSYAGVQEGSIEYYEKYRAPGEEVAAARPAESAAAQEEMPADYLRYMKAYANDGDEEEEEEAAPVQPSFEQPVVGLVDYDDSDEGDN